MSVIDAAMRFAQCGAVISHDALRDELLRRLADGTVTGRSVAKHLGVAPARISEIKSGVRQIQPREMSELASLLGLVEEPPVEAAKVISIWSRIPEGRRDQALDILETFASRA